MGREEFEKYLSKVQWYCSRAEKCEMDVRMYLRKQNLEDSDVSKIVDRLIADNFIDDERYARAFVSDSFRFNKWGKMKIRQILLAKGVESKYITHYLNAIDEDEYLKTLENIMKTKLKTTHNEDEYKLKASIFRFVASRGFEIELIEKIWNKLK